ncbi:MAG: YdeI/OmpD-associated family protein [Novosphingobium sp.]
MASNPKIDAYIEKAAPFAQPILRHVRALVHATIPDLDEAVKWGMPHFTYKGKNLAGFAAFKAHAAVMIHGDGRQGDAMGQFGKIASLDDLPSDRDLAAKLQEARARIDYAGTALKPKAVPKAPKAEIPMPDDFAAALAAMQGVRDRFDAMPPGARREYLEWIVEAKRPETRATRIATAAEWIAEGKKRNWKYEGY